MMSPDLKDALILLRWISSGCDGKPENHNWYKCQRCLAIYGIYMRYDLSIKLLKIAISELEKYE